MKKCPNIQPAKPAIQPRTANELDGLIIPTHKLVAMLTRRAVLIAVAVMLFTSMVALQSVARGAITGANHFDNLIEHREYPKLEHMLPEAKLSEIDREYFEGVLANRRNELEKSISLLKKAVPSLKESNPKRAAVALRSLADDYTKTFQYAEADKTYAELLGDFSKRLPNAERQAMKDDGKTVHLLRDVPPQTVEMNGAFSISIHQSELGTIESELSVNGVTRSWILDTGANYSVLTESSAKAMGLKLSQEAAQTQGASGAENPLHIAIIPELKIGSAAVRNVVILVLPDKALLVPMQKGKHQIEAILGYPVLSALERLTFSKDTLKVEPGGDNSGAAMYMQELNPLVECRVNGHDMLLFFDTGASSTALTARYYDAFQKEFTNAPRKKRGVAGAGGIKYLESFILPEVSFEIGGEKAVLKDVPVDPEPQGRDFDLLYGNLGRDVTAEFKSFTFDFKAMRFRLAK